MKNPKSAFSSDRGRSDGVHRAERIISLVLFAVLATFPKSEQDIADTSTIPNIPDLLGKAGCCHFHPLIPPDLLKAFFFLYALEGQITESKKGLTL